MLGFWSAALIRYHQLGESAFEPFNSVETFDFGCAETADLKVDIQQFNAAVYGASMFSLTVTLFYYEVVSLFLKKQNQVD